jgi:hypothetical protein
VVHSENHPEHRLLLTNEFFQVPYPAKEETFRNKGMVVFPIAPDETNVPLAIAVRCPEFAEHVHFDLIANRKFGIRPGAGWGKLIRTVEMPGQDLDKWRYNFPEAFLPGSGHIAPVLTIPRSSLTNEELEGALLLTAQGKDRPANMVSFNLKFVTVTNRASYTPTAHPDSGWRMKIISHPPTNPSPVTPVP